jgi:threonine synthase
MIGWNGLLTEYAEWFDLDGVDEIITLQEGNTPLIRANRLSEKLEADIWLKYEGLNPSGSFKDRGMTMAITKAKANGAKTVICGSTGNTSAAAAAYAGKAGMDCVVARRSPYRPCRRTPARPVWTASCSYPRAG